MKNIVIAAGYATRLYPLTENFPKPLLEIGNTTILGRLIDDIDKNPAVTEHIIITNHKFFHHFEAWKNNIKTNKPITLLDDGTETNETRLGAVCDLLLALNTFSIDDDILVIAADNILDFSLNDFILEFQRKGTSLIMCHHEPDLKALQRTGVVALDEQMKVLVMQEKPEKPVANWAVPPFYIYKKEDIPLILHSLEHGCKFDAPGNLAHYLIEVTTLHAWQMNGKRFDIGTLESYHKAQELFSM